jgi:microcystin-dependent protein
LEFWGSTTPNSSFAFPFGQPISRTAYATLFVMFGTTYGVGDGTTTFNLPDVRGRVVASPDNMGGTALGLLTNVASALGSKGGEQAHPLVAGEIPSINSTGTGSVVVQTVVSNIVQASAGFAQIGTGGGSFQYTGFPLNTAAENQIQSQGSVAVNSTSTNTGGGAHNNIQPTIVANRILRII